MQIKLNDAKSIDLEKLVDSRLLVQANSGGGKSWLLRRLLEQSHGKIQQIILDPEGEFGTLREKYDYILAGKGGDTPAEPRSAALLARRLLELNVSAIVDLYELPPQERKRFVRLFIEAMVNAPKELYHPCLVVIDEAHVFVPQVGESEASGAVIDLATRGRKRGYCAILATQRISKLHKDAAAECNNKLIGRTGLDVDMKRAGDELGFTTRDQLHSLRQLEPGEFFAFGPAISNDVEKVRVGPVKTAHPKAGARISAEVAPPTSAIKKILGKLADLPHEAEAEAKTVAELRNEIARLKREATSAEKPVAAIDPKHMEQAVAWALKQRDKEWEAKSDAASREIKRLTAILKKIHDSTLDIVRKAPEEDRAVGGGLMGGNQLLSTTKNPVPKNVEPRPLIGTTDFLVTGPEQRILDAIAWLDSIGVSEPDQTAVAFLAGYTYGGGGFNNPKGALRTKGYIEYVPGNKIKLTAIGAQAANQPVQPLTQEELHRKVLSVLETPHVRILRPLLENGGEPISKEELASIAGYAYGSGGFNNPLGRLRSLGLIQYLPGGMVQARDILFI